MQIITPLIITLTSLMLVSCTVLRSPGARAPISKLNTVNLVKNPQSGVYKIAAVNTNSIIERFAFNTNSTLHTNAITITPGNIVHIAAPVTSIDIFNPSNASGSSNAVVVVVTEYKPKASWVKLGLYYLVALHLLVLGYYLYDRQAFKRITNPFVRKVSRIKTRSIVKKKL